VEAREPIGWITLARPEKKNALDRQMADELTQALARLDAAAGVRAIVIAADGDDFCAGADLEALERMLDAGPEVHAADARALGGAFVALRALAKPVIAAVRGRALAGGAGLASACDIVIAHENAQFGYPEVRIGFVPAMVMTMLRRTVGEKHAADLVLTGRLIDAREAERLGLVSRVSAAASFDTDVESAAGALAKSPASAVALTKRLFYALDGLDFSAGIDAGVRANVEARATDDFRAGVKRFVAHRGDQR
jgi:methylglutaconyl-CoA hydratase